MVCLFQTQESSRLRMLASLDLFLESARAQLKTLMTGSSLPDTVPATSGHALSASASTNIELPPQPSTTDTQLVISD